MTRKITRTGMLAASCVGILLGAAALLWSPMAEAQSTFSVTPQVQPSQPAKIDRSLFGARKGILTKAQGTTVWIDRVKYSLATGALVEKQGGAPTRLGDWDGVAYKVQYWLGSGATDGQIIQLIITFPH